jgi:hypothetical protein
MEFSLQIIDRWLYAKAQAVAANPSLKTDSLTAVMGSK